MEGQVWVECQASAPGVYWDMAVCCVCVRMCDKVHTLWTTLVVQPFHSTMYTPSPCSHYLQVKTKVPFLLKFTLREYQHIGLDWLATIYQVTHVHDTREMYVWQRCGSDTTRDVSVADALAWISLFLCA